MAIFLPRNNRTDSGEALTSSWPSSQISPETLALRLLCSPRMPRLVTDLPEPDSPTMPSVRPRSSLNDTGSTARTRPSSVGKWTRSSRSSKKDEGVTPRSNCRTISV